MTPALPALPAVAPLPMVWRRALPALLAVLACLLTFYGNTAKAMVSIWARSDTFAHAFLVLPIVLWLVWRQRHALAALEPKPCPWVLLPMAALAFAWLLGDLASINSVTQLAMTALLVLAVPLVVGIHVAKAIAFPLAFMFFAVPLGEFLMPQLISWTADFTVLALQATGIPVYREGNQFTIPSGQWSVVEACSGVRYLIASFMVGTLFGYLTYRSPLRRWLFAGISLVVPILANWLRAYLIVLLGHVSGNQLAAGADHLIYGWLFFGVVIGLLYAVGMIWSETGTAPAPVPLTAARQVIAPRSLERFWGTAVAAMLLGAFPHLFLWKLGSIDNPAPPQLARVSDPVGGWRAVDRPMSDWTPAFQNPSAQMTSTYSLQDREVGVYIGYYRGQNYQRKLVSSDNELVKSNDRRWALVSAGGTQTLRTPDQAVPVRIASLRRASGPGSAEQRLLAWQVYWVGDRLTTSDQWAKAYAAFDRLLQRRDDSAVIVLYARDEPPGVASPLLHSFAQANFAAIVAQLRKNRDAARASIAVNSYEPSSETRK